MLISIVTPSYNQAKYLPDLIQSVKSQIHRPIEHIIIDGASRDGTVELLKEYSRNSDGIAVTWKSEKDRGQAHAINKGFAMARGEIVGWINSDDVYFHTGVFEKVLEVFASHPEVDVIHGNVAKISADNLITLIWSIPEFDYRRMFFGGKVSQPTVFFRRRVIEENKLREGILALDYEFWLRIGERYQFFRINDVLAGDRNQPERISQRFSAELRQSHLVAMEEHAPKMAAWQTVWYRVTSLPQRVLHRALGLVKYASIKRTWDQLAFPAREDGWLRFCNRQLFTRIRDLPIRDDMDKIQ